MPSPSRALLVLLLSASAALANVEKVIFVAPPPVNVPPGPPTLSDLPIYTLTPSNATVRTELPRIFADIPMDSHENPAKFGKSSWVLLDQLTEGQRYEFRVCWAAIEPSLFALDVYDLDTVWDTPELIQSLSDYANSRQADPGLQKRNSPPRRGEREASVMLVHMRTVANYFADNLELMRNPPPVLVDFILDPFLFNIVNQSIVPTICYLVVVGTFSFFIARWFAARLEEVARAQVPQVDKKN